MKPVNDLRQPNEMAFLVLATGFTLAGRLSYWTIYDLKKQFQNSALRNMHWPTVHILGEHFDSVLSHEYEERRYGNWLVAEKFAK